MSQNKITTYLLYAIGEIFLVVVGILIAVSIDDWSEAIKKSELEKSYLKEIKISLEVDLQKADRLTAINNRRLSHSDSMLRKMENRTYEEMVRSIIRHIEPSLDYGIFEMHSIGFDNMVSSESIALISNDTLRKTLSEYYTDTNDWQDRIETQSREYIDYIFPRLMSAPLLEAAIGYNLPVKQPYNLKVNEDPVVINMFISLIQLTGSQNRMIKRKKESATRVIELIDLELKR